MGLLDDAKRLLSNRSFAYKRIFLGHGDDTDLVLQDLARFCRAHETTFSPDPRLSDVLVGRREVWTRLQHCLQLTDEEIWKIYGNQSLKPEE